MREVYVASVTELLESGTNVDSVLKNLKAVLKERGHKKLFPAILKNVVIRLEENAENKVPVVYVKEMHDVAAQKEHIKAALKALSADVAPTVVTDKTLIGGFVAEYEHRRIDQSYKNALLNLYQKLTN